MIAMRRSLGSFPSLLFAFWARKSVDISPNCLPLDSRGRWHALRRRVEAEQHVDLLLLDQSHRLVDGDVRLALSVGVHGLDLIALDAAFLDEIVDHDLGAERVQLGAAARERAGVVVDDADLE